MRSILLCAFLITCNTTFSQSTLIKYDYQNETFVAYKIKKNGDTVKLKRAYAYKNIPVKVVVENVNTFAYNVQFEVESQAFEPIGGENDMNMLIENFTMGANAFGDLVGEVKSNDIYQALFIDGEFQGLGALTKLGYTSTDISKAIKAVEDMAIALEETQEDIKKVSRNIKVTVEELVLTEFIDEQIHQLQMNTEVSPQEMKDRSKALIEKVMAGNVSLEGVISLSETNSTELMKKYFSFRTTYSKYQIIHNSIIDQIEELREKMDEEIFNITFSELRSEMKVDSSEINLNMEVLDLLMKEYSKEKIRGDYLSAFNRYDRIKHADFKINYSVNGEQDFTTLTINFLDANVADSANAGGVLKTRKLNIPTRGGLRINSSAGMSFLRFFNGHQSYSSTGGIVGEHTGDAFKPSLNTMFHFYKQTPSPVAVGGSFGFGVPIEGEKDFMYLLGGSVIFGKTQRVILNIGAFGGKLEKLDGIGVGDAIPEGSIVPTTRIFDFGAYVGLTFNISQLF